MIARTFTGGCFPQILGRPRYIYILAITCKSILNILTKAVVLAHRPPISIPRTSVSPALLEELLGEISSLASVYHKPAETFVGRGRVGADAIRKGTEYVYLL